MYSGSDMGEPGPMKFVVWFSFYRIYLFPEM